MERQDLAAALGAGVGHALERGELHVAGGGMRGREVEAHLANETRVFG